MAKLKRKSDTEVIKDTIPPPELCVILTEYFEEMWLNLLALLVPVPFMHETRTRSPLCLEMPQHRKVQATYWLQN